MKKIQKQLFFLTLLFLFVGMHYSVPAQKTKSSRNVKKSAKTSRLAGAPNRQSFYRVLSAGTLEAYFELYSSPGIYSRFEYLGCKAVLPRNSNQNIVVFAEAPTQNGPGELAPILMQSLGVFNAIPNPGVNLLEGNYFAGGGTINLRIRGPMGGGTSPIPTNRITIRRSSGEGSAYVWCFAAGYEE